MLREQYAKFQRYISAGDKHLVILKPDGTVTAGGNNERGQCNTSEWRNIVAISADTRHTVGLKANGTVVATVTKPSGTMSFLYTMRGHISAAYDWNDIIAISSGLDTAFGLTKNGIVLKAGWEAYHLTSSANRGDIVAISNNDARIGLTAEGKVVILSYVNNVTSLSIDSWYDIVAVASGSNHVVGLKADGTVVASSGPDMSAWITGQKKTYNPCDTTNWKNIIAITAGGEHTVGITADCTVVANVNRLRGLSRYSCGNL